MKITDIVRPKIQADQLGISIVLVEETQQTSKRKKDNTMAHRRKKTGNH